MQASDLSLQFREQCQSNESVHSESVHSESVHTFLELTNTSGSAIGDAWRLYFSLGLKPIACPDLTRVMIDGRYGYLQPTAGWQLAPGETLVIEIENWLFSGMQLLQRQGFHLVALEGDNELSLGAPKVQPAILVPLTEPRLPILSELSPNTVLEPRPETPDPDAQPQIIIPAAKEYALSAETIAVNTFDLIHGADISTESGILRDALAEMNLPVTAGGLPLHLDIDAQMEADYRLETDADRCAIIGNNTAGLFYGAQSLLQLLTETESGWQLPKVSITDRADFKHRCLFVDIARHFQPLTQLKKVVDAMARYKLNRLQLGVSNDEGWRLEIVSLPALTDIGARRSYQTHHSDGTRRALPPAWGDDHREVEGHLSANDFIDLLKYANTRHVEIIVEINVPAHANAMIKALDGSHFNLLDPEDQSSHQSAQGYRHNVLNIGMPDTYRVISLILEDLVKMYQFAGVALKHIHLGGDEVPAGAWLHSPACQQLPVWRNDWNPDSPADAKAATEALTAFHCQRLIEVVREAADDVEIGLWHEMSPYAGTQPTYNVWTTEAGDLAPLHSVIERQQSFIISNASALYLDMPYGMDPEEPGLPWAAYTDTRSIYEFDPVKAWDIDAALTLVEGLQAQLWSETVFDEALMDYYLFPRLIAVAERAWNRQPVPDTWDSFLAALAKRELPWLESRGIRFRPLRQPQTNLS